MSIKVQIRQLPHAGGLPLPRFMSPQAAGADLFAAVDEPITVAPMQRTLVPTGIAIALPAGFEAQIRPRSGLAIKNGITLLNSPGTIDADYRGEIKIILANLGEEPFIIRRGDRIAQMVITRIEQPEWELVEELPDSLRGDGGFGSSGV